MNPLKKSALIALGALLCSQTVSATPFDREEDLLSPPKTAALLPSGKGDQPVLIHSENAATYRSYLVPEMVPLVKAGLISLKAATAMPFEWRYDDEWIRNSLEVTEDTPEVTIDKLMRRGFPYGVAAVINREEDPEKFSHKVLWNIISAGQAFPFQSAKFELQWGKPDNSHGTVNRLGGFIDRAWLEKTSGSNQSGQLFREMIRFTEPVSISPLTFLTFRFFGKEEDLIWIYSAAIHKTRQLSGSVRSDSLAGSAFSPDDLFLWAGKPELVKVRLDKPVTALVPFSAAGFRKPAVSEDGSCRTVTLPVSKTHLALSEDTVFALRDLWKIELASEDPFSLYGRQILYVDPLLMLPVYKIVFDVSGRPWKFAMTQWGLGAAGKDEKRFPVHESTLIYDLLSGKTSRLNFVEVKTCEAFPQGKSLADFDPGKLGGPQTEKPKESQPVKK